MANYIFSIVLLIIALAAIELRKSYHTVPKTELSYRARQGDALATKIYTAVSYEDSLEALLWLVIVVCVAGSLMLFSSVAPVWLAFIAIAVYLWVAFAWLPKIRVNSFSNKLAKYITPTIVWALNYLHPLFQKLNKALLKPKPKSHTGIYDTKGLLDLIDSQKEQQDSRINAEDLELIKNILKLGDKTVGDLCLKWSKIKHVSSNETVGPVLLDELHKSGQQFVPVVDDDLDEVVGMIDITRLDISTTAEIKDIMDSTHHLNEDDTLQDALAAITDTSYPVYVVLDKKQRLYGLLSLKDIISQLTGSEAKAKEDNLEAAVVSKNLEETAEV